MSCHAHTLQLLLLLLLSVLTVVCWLWMRVVCGP